MSKVMGLWFIANALGQGINSITVRLFGEGSPEMFFLAYAFIALLAGTATLLMRKNLLRLAGGVR
jgi:dipeptide/tripeptide permease